MRNIFAIILVLVVSVVFTTNNVEAARYHKNRNHKVCTCPKGTMKRGCPVHGNDCLAIGPHEHEDTKGRRADLPTFCTVDDQNFLVYEPTCKGVKRQIRDRNRAIQNYYRGQKRIAQERSREQDRMSQRFQRGFRDIPIVSDFQREIQRETRRAYNDARRDIRRGIRDEVRGWFGRR